MNMILKKQITNMRGRAGFTLVEVIVVLVILAILAAIAIPALTGYIDKANDKKYIADARNAIAAYRTVIDEMYADGTLGKGLPKDPSSKWSNYLVDGEPASSAGNPPWSTNLKFINPNRISMFINIENYDPAVSYPNSKDARTLFAEKAAELTGTPFIPYETTPGYTELGFYIPADASYSILNAQSFLYRYYPEGVVTGKSAVYVAYGLSGLEDEYATHADLYNDLKTKAHSDPNAGYQVIHIRKI
ncbi:MAG: prepilin-type N-terminal cleavage/methylation domain-containing protein [Clostridiales Family XIII bacterium]|jgi:prepilin-type N-terminal cleavage/methylation domain-containing protein|nr:prepilin-type N-terminal cleavage/methylation domain-containing protein [Clostridiales Family XIII bacterium]